MKRRPLVAGNWKMNGTIQEARQLVEGILRASRKLAEVEIVLFPPFTALAEVRDRIQGSPLLLGAQNMHWEEKGAYTGEVSGGMLKELGCRYVIIGHSERRALFGETDESVQKKISAVFRTGLSPILCVGETLQQREANQTWKVIERQLEIGLDKAKAADSMNRLVIAYEPVWAIGTGRNATPAQAQEVHALIRSWLDKRFGKTEADSIRIQYGGSVKPDNAAELMSQADVDGALVGGASLDTTSFTAIAEAAALQRKGASCSTD
ncbi:MAG: triose-phosphate isomerase [Candidatus Omnitrophica bacterium]|nr:triose-phosphate isomerase [Candidatus Omnitrophota bacterium]